MHILFPPSLATEGTVTGTHSWLQYKLLAWLPVVCHYMISASMIWQTVRPAQHGSKQPVTGSLAGA